MLSWEFLLCLRFVSFGVSLWYVVMNASCVGTTGRQNFPLSVVNCIRLWGIIHQFALCLGSLHPLGPTKGYRASVPHVKLTEIIWMECLLNCQSPMKARLSRRGLYDLSKHSSRFLRLWRTHTGKYIACLWSRNTGKLKYTFCLKKTLLCRLNRCRFYCGNKDQIMYGEEWPSSGDWWRGTRATAHSTVLRGPEMNKSETQMNLKRRYEWMFYIIYKLTLGGCFSPVSSALLSLSRKLKFEAPDR